MSGAGGALGAGPDDSGAGGASGAGAGRAGEGAGAREASGAGPGGPGGTGAGEAPGRTILRDGRAYLFFSGYSYLGMSHVPDFIALLKEGLDRYGALFPSSRISNTTLPLYGHLEHYLAQLTGAEAAVTYGSGFLACQAVGRLLENETVLVAPGTHPATGFRAAPGSYDDWCDEVRTRAWDQDHYVLVADSVDPLRGEVHDFVFLQELPREKRFTVLIDDSHGIGWMGEHGEGISGALMHLPQVEYILVYSLAKALHVQGGAVSCSRAWGERLRRSAFYTASTPMAPAFAHALLSAGALYEVQRARLAHNMELLRSPVLEDARLPVRLSKKAGLGAFLETRGILLSSFAYPDPGGPLLERVVLSALHERGDLEALMDACNVWAGTHTNS